MIHSGLHCHGDITVWAQPRKEKNEGKNNEMRKHLHSQNTALLQQRLNLIQVVFLKLSEPG